MTAAAVKGGYYGTPGKLSYENTLSYPGHYSIAPALVGQDSNIIRSHGNLNQISTYSKNIQTPYSHVQKADVRISNDALAFHHHPATVTYASPPIHHSAPIAYPALPAPVNEHHYMDHGVYHHRPSYIPKVAYSPGSSLLGVAYSSAPVVSHMSYTNGYGVSYGY